MKGTYVEKGIVVSVILLFIGVAVVPCINQSVVKAATDDDLVEVTTQACGIQGNGNTTVKLTREQYKDIQQYLVEFSARLNQTTTKEEAIHLFKEAVVELNTYGLLPKEITIEQAQRLVLGTNAQDKKISQNIEPSRINSNLNCFIIGQNNEDIFFQPLRNKVIYNMFHLFTKIWIPNFLRYPLAFLELLFTIFSEILISKNPAPLKVGSLIHYGVQVNDIISNIYETYYAKGYVLTIGLFGIQVWDGEFIGDLPLPIPFELSLAGVSETYYCGVLGFTGLRLTLHPTTYYFGFAEAVKLKEIS